MHTTSFLPILSFAALALSSPLVIRSESWPIPVMDVHFMGRDTGLPGNEWPESAKFNSTLDFTVAFPDGDVKCHGDWKYQNVATTPFTCADGVEFVLSPTADGTFHEIAFTLSVSRAVGDVKYIANHEVRGNNPGGPNSYLSCLGGPPLDGLRCHVTGWASTSSPLVLSGDIA